LYASIVSCLKRIDNRMKRCVAYCTALSFDLVKLISYFKSSYPVTRYRDVVHVPLVAKGGDVFIFSYGAIVCWGLENRDEREILKELKPFEQQSLDVLEDDVFHYLYGDQAKIEDDEITLPDRDILTKLAISHGIAQSVKLGFFERTIRMTSDLTKEMPVLLAREGSIKLSRKDIRRLMGRLFIDRSSVNLHQELLDTPEFFWEQTDLEPYYNLVKHYLDRDRRVVVLNQRLAVLQELFDMLATELNHQHSSRLEWTIIWLIVIEVLLHIVTDIFGYF